MNHYTRLLNKIVEVAEVDPNINTITDGAFTEMDWNKVTEFPLLHIQINGGNFSSEQTVTFNVQIGCFNKRNHTNIGQTGVKWYDKILDIFRGKRVEYSDNRNDNMNECLNTLNRIWLVLKRNWDDSNITASENPNFEPDMEMPINTLDGYVLTFEVEIPNLTISLCEPL
jgi:hypothetical protein